MDIKTALLMIDRTIDSLEIKATKENCDKLLGCHIAIGKIIGEIDKAHERTARAHDGNGEG